MADKDASKKAKRSKRRGARGELEVVALFKEYGWMDASRNLEQSRDGGGDILNGPLHIECKFTERLALRAAWKQACKAATDGRPMCVAHRCSNEPWLATVRLDYLLGLLVAARDGSS